MDCNFTVISRNHFYVSTFCVVKQQMFPFSIVSMLLMHASPNSLQCSWYMPPAKPFNTIEDACLSPASLQCYWGCIASSSLPPSFKSLVAYYLLPPFHSDSETHLTTCCKSHFLLIRFCFIHFDFLIITTMRRNYSLVSHVLFISQHCSPILACSTYQKSMNFSHNSVK